MTDIFGDGAAIDPSVLVSVLALAGTLATAYFGARATTRQTAIAEAHWNDERTERALRRCDEDLADCRARSRALRRERTRMLFALHDAGVSWPDDPPDPHPVLDVDD